MSVLRDPWSHCTSCSSLDSDLGPRRQGLSHSPLGFSPDQCASSQFRTLAPFGSECAAPAHVVVDAAHFGAFRPKLSNHTPVGDLSPASPSQRGWTHQHPAHPSGHGAGDELAAAATAVTSADASPACSTRARPASPSSPSSPSSPASPDPPGRGLWPAPGRFEPPPHLPRYIAVLPADPFHDDWPHW